MNRKREPRPSPRRRARRIAITGGIGCGKTEAAAALRELGVPVLEADEIAREVLAGSNPVSRRVARAFGPGVLSPDGMLDRKALADRVFRDPDARERLNRLTHPEILRRCRRWMAGQRGPVLAVVIPLLHELGLEKEWDEVWCVAARRRTALHRMGTRGWSRAEAVRRMRAQWPLRIKAARSTRVIRNDGTIRELKRRVKAALGPNPGRTTT